MIEVEPYAAVLVPIILGLIEVAKMLRFPKRFAPLLALIFGIISGIVYVDSGDLAKDILVGIGIGLASVGLYSGTKNTVSTVSKEE